ncbi:alpha/beta hydrolase [Aquidulcibacter sp.]|uniref:alpha/beta hydrolase n=1 Tax=Aquidulcibacter sp. TaxID=2052990 RepID=UPI0025BC22FF|nr:alpha/beta hydrolase [Aquidulcibacter sp.]MCA3693435.1 alpha/beta hydrolase [Aquidulcibacter sp.]
MGHEVPASISQAEIAAVKTQVQAMTDQLREPPSIMQLRESYDAMGQVYPIAEGVTVTTVSLNGVAAEKLTGTINGDDATLLYLHGGGYGIGSPSSHRHLVAQFVAVAGVTAYSADYRLAPEHPFPAAVDDAVAAYRALLDQGIPAASIIIAGDSAGGGLTVATAVKLKAEALPQPAGLFIISPWVNLQQEGASYAAKANSDFIVDMASLERWASLYLNGTLASEPLASPVLADLSGLAPLLIHVGSEEVLLADSLRLAEAAGMALVDVTLKIVPYMPHVFHYMWPQVTAARIAIGEAATWIRARTT